MKIVPIIDKIVEYDGVYYAITKEKVTLFATDNQEIANMYYAIPEVLARQAEIIASLNEQLNAITDEYNTILMGALHGTSNLFH
jgi:hypothetical protein